MTDQLRTSLPEGPEAPQAEPVPDPREEERARRTAAKPLRASPFSWETAARVRAPWRR